MQLPIFIRHPAAAVLNSRLVSVPLRNRNFGAFTLGSGISLVGMWMQRIAIGWLTWKLTESGFWLGLVAAADFFPVLLIGPIAGAAADRWDRLKVVKVTQSISLVQATTLWLLTATGHINVVLLLALATFQGFVVSFNQPARLALVPSLVSDSELGAAVAINSVVFNLARFIGPILAGFAILWSGVSAAFATNAMTYIVFLAALARIRIEKTASEGKRRSFRADLWEGIAYTAGHPAIATMLILLIAIGVGGRPINDLLPGLAADVFHSGAAGLSLLASAIAAGAILGGLWVGNRTNANSHGKVAVICSIIAAGGAIGAVATDLLWIAVPAVMLFGFCTTSAGISIQTHIQLASDPRMRGRVMGLYALIFRGAPAFGALATGTVSTWLGLRWAIALGALLVIGISAAIWMRRSRFEASAPDAAAPVPASGPGQATQA